MSETISQSARRNIPGNLNQDRHPHRLKIHVCHSYVEGFYVAMARRLLFVVSDTVEVAFSLRVSISCEFLRTGSGEPM
jgi:hypothetical protein